MDINNPLVAYLAVFLAGLAASASPCSLLMFPIVIGYVGGYAAGDWRKSSFSALFFSLGLAITFVGLGLLAALTGSLLGDIGGYWRYILGGVAIIMGLQVLGVLQWSLPTFNATWTKNKGLWGALIVGLFFGLATSPCSTPILAVILTYVAAKQNLLYGASLLLVYALAYTCLIFLVGVSAGMAGLITKSKAANVFASYFHKAAGLILIIGGLWFIFQ